MAVNHSQPFAFIHLFLKENKKYNKYYAIRILFLTTRRTSPMFAPSKSNIGPYSLFCVFKEWA